MSNTNEWITLNESEQAIAKFIGKSRYQSARTAGVKDQRLDSSGEMLDLNGFGAELAFCRLFNLYPDLAIGVRSGSSDAVTHKGTTVDVKTTRYQNGHILATLKKKVEDSDMYVMMIGDFPKYKFAGYIDAKDLLKKDNIKDLGHGKGYAVKISDLTKIPNSTLNNIKRLY